MQIYIFSQAQSWPHTHTPINTQCCRKIRQHISDQTSRLSGSSLQFLSICSRDTLCPVYENNLLKVIVIELWGRVLYFGTMYRLNHCCSFCRIDMILAVQSESSNGIWDTAVKHLCRKTAQSDPLYNCSLFVFWDFFLETSLMHSCPSMQHQWKTSLPAQKCITTRW